MIDRIKNTIAPILELNVLDISDDFSQSLCGKWDSLNHLNIIVALEDEFDVSFEPEEIALMSSVISISNILKKK